MATTTNYGWTTPDDTALVKDGAAAIRTLGSSVDTTTKNLNPETTLGDLAYRSSTANVKTRLGLGTAGQVLTVNSGANAPEWATVSAGGMTLLSTTTLSGATTTISGISGSYNTLFMVFTGLTNATAAGQFRIAPNGTTNLSNSMVNGSEGTGTTSGGGRNNDYIRLMNFVSVPDNTNANNGGFLYLYNYASSTSFKPFEGSLTFVNNLATKSTETTDGAFFSNTAITSLVFSNSGGNLSTGTVLLYGVK